MVKQKICVIGKDVCCRIWCVIALALKVVCLGCGLQPSVQTQAGWLCLKTLSATPLLASPGQLVPITGCCGRWMNLEWLHAAPGWPEGRLLSCVDHCHQKGLSHREGGRALELSAAAAASPCACYMPASNTARLCICLLSGTQQENRSLHTSMNMLTHACSHAGASPYLSQPAGRDASLGSPWDLHGSTRKSGAADPIQSLVIKRE